MKLKGSGVQSFSEIQKHISLLYPEYEDQELVLDFIYQIVKKTQQNLRNSAEGKAWYKNSFVYGLYVQHFNRSFEGLIDKLDYLQDLGVQCLWLLPILKSPMKDEGYDISDYYHVRSNLFEEKNSTKHKAIFQTFLKQAKDRNIRIIFDIAVNHVSMEHPWFKDALENPKSTKRDFFIWSDSGQEYADARLIFKGMVNSNWTKLEGQSQYHFHRFYPHQPDLNFRNPQVLIEILKVLLFWIDRGVDGFRMDAIPYLWKEEGTPCENHPLTHSILKIIRFVCENSNPHILLLAEAGQKPIDLVKYFGQDDECNAAYHFPLMPRLYRTLAEQKGDAILDTLDSKGTPKIPEQSQWFTFLRCHDELSLEMVDPWERKFIYDHLVREKHWDFRQGEGISARLASLFPSSETNFLIQSLLFCLPETPVYYFGDELLIPNNESFAKAREIETGNYDSRNLVRGNLDWEYLEKTFEKKTSILSLFFGAVKSLITIRRKYYESQITKIRLISGTTGLFVALWQNVSDLIIFIFNLCHRTIPGIMSFAEQDVKSLNLSTSKRTINHHRINISLNPDDYELILDNQFKEKASQATDQTEKIKRLFETEIPGHSISILSRSY